MEGESAKRKVFCGDIVREWAGACCHECSFLGLACAALCGLRDAGWDRSHLHCCSDLVGLDIFCSSLFCMPCLYANALTMVGLSRLRLAWCCWGLNRRHMVLKYKLPESLLQSILFHLLPPCSFLSCMQELHEISLRENRSVPVSRCYSGKCIMSSSARSRRKGRKVDLPPVPERPMSMLRYEEHVYAHSRTLDGGTHMIT